MKSWPYFNPRVDKMLTCSCGCGRMEMKDEFMNQIVLIREAVGIPFRITSGFRCPTHNARVSSTGEAGPHTWGRALDIAADSRMKSLIQTAASGIGFNRFGIAKTFIHLDDLTEDDGFPEHVIWTY